MKSEDFIDEQRMQLASEIAALDRQAEECEKRLRTATNSVWKDYTKFLEDQIARFKERRELLHSSVAKLELLKAANEGRCNPVLPPWRWQAATRLCLGVARRHMIM